MDLKETVSAELEQARARSLGLLEPLPPDALVRQHSPLMSPLVWDLAHVGNYEDLWLVRALGAEAIRPDLDDIYDAFRHPRPNRPTLPLLGPADARTYIADVRSHALDVLDRVDLDAGATAGGLVAGGFVYGMVVQHEHQHDETMLATLQLMDDPGCRSDESPAGGGPAVPSPPERAEVLVPGGPFDMGTSVDPWAYDNERPGHRVVTAPFFIDVTPVTNRAYLGFMGEGGYDDPRWWVPEGWAWRRQEGLTSPQFWRPEGDGAWSVLRFGRRVDLPLDEPVQHVCWYEADAFARWAGKRLPTEAEWEKAAAWDPATGRSHRYPWGDDGPAPGHANLGQRRFAPAAVAAYPEGRSAVGCLGMIGDVWEWTASDFEAYPGFASFPYREYSEVFFGAGYKVLRGGSWATHATAVRTTFRNWDHAIRRQIFAGFRCARDAA